MRNVLRFAGELRDPVSSGYALGNGYRWYLPSIMRFNAPDDWSPFGRGGVNPYAYCGCDPINFGDPSGHVLMRLNEFFLPEADDVHVESVLDIGRRLDRAMPASGHSEADMSSSMWDSTPSMSTAAVHASRPSTPALSPEPPRSPIVRAPADSPGAAVSEAVPSTSSGIAEPPPTGSTFTFKSLLEEALSRPLGGLPRHTLATRRTANLVAIFKENGVTAADLPDYPGMQETSRLLGYQVPYSTISMNANKVLHRPNMSQDIQDRQIEVLKAFDEWSPNMES